MCVCVCVCRRVHANIAVSYAAILIIYGVFIKLHDKYLTRDDAETKK